MHTKENEYVYNIGVNPMEDMPPTKIGLRGTVMHYVPPPYIWLLKGVFGENATLNMCHSIHWNVQSHNL